MAIGISRHDKALSFDLLLFFLFFAYSFLGFNGEITNYIKLILFFIWATLTYINKRKLVQDAFARKETWLLLIFVFFFSFSSLFCGDALNTVKWVAMYLMQFGSIVAFFVYSKESASTFTLIIRVCLAIITLVSINALLFYLVYPNAARELAANSSAFNNIAIGNGYPLAFSLALISTFIFYCLVNGIIKRHRLIYVILLALYFVTIVLTESTTTLLALAFGLAATLIGFAAFGRANRPINNIRLICGLILIICFIVVLYLSLHKIGAWLCSISIDNQDQLYGRRLYRIGEKLMSFGTDQATTNYVDQRFSTILLSLSTFAHNPIIGVGYKYGNIYSNGYPFGVGQHSEFADILAQFGLVGLFTLLGIYFSFIKRCNLNSVNIGLIISALVLCIFNPFMSFQGCYTIFFLIPLWSNFLGKSNEVQRITRLRII